MKPNSSKSLGAPHNYVTSYMAMSRSSASEKRGTCDGVFDMNRTVSIRSVDVAREEKDDDNDAYNVFGPINIMLYGPLYYSG